MATEYLESDYLPIDVSNLSNEKESIQMDEDRFKNGVDDGAYFAGFASALFNSGLDEDNVTEIVKCFIEHGEY